MRKIFLPDHLLVFLLEPPDFRAFFVGDEEPASSVFAAFFFDGLDPCCSP